MEIPTGEQIEKASLNSGLTQSELANAAEVSQPFIARIENNDVDPNIEKLHRIVTAIRVRLRKPDFIAGD